MDSHLWTIQTSNTFVYKFQYNFISKDVKIDQFFQSTPGKPFYVSKLNEFDIDLIAKKVKIFWLLVCHEMTF